MRLPLVVLLLCSFPSLAGAQNRPLLTEMVTTVKRGHIRLEVGAEQQWTRAYTLSGLKGDLTRLGIAALRWGAGETVEIQVHGVIQDFLRVHERFPAPYADKLDFAGNWTNDFADLTMVTKFVFKKEATTPALGFRFGVELPNASNETGLGNDETNAFGEFLFQKTVQRAQLVGSLGLAILGDPLTPGSQDDVITYGIGFVYPLGTQVNAVMETTGRFGDTNVGTEPQSIVRLGTQVQKGVLSWDAGLLFGFRDTDPSFGLVFGLSRTF